MLELFMLGTGGTMPLVTRALSSSIIRVGGKSILMDCGEATQIEIQKTTVGFKDISYICITHLHADHVSGLLGILLALKASEKRDTLTIIGPKNIKEYVQAMYLITSGFGFPINFIELSLDGTMCDIIDGDIRIRSTPASHSVPCFAYSVELERKPRFLLKKANEAGVPLFLRGELAKGYNIKYGGVSYKADDYIVKDRKGLKISYVTDTRPLKRLYSFIQGSDIAVIEGMYRDKEDMEKAKEKKHMIWDESISLGKGNGVKKIVLTHFSPSLQIEPDDEEKLKLKCPIAELGRDGKYFILKYEEEQEDEDVLNIPRFTRQDRKQMKKNPDLIDNSQMIIKFCKNRNLLRFVNDIERLSAYKYRLVLNDRPYIIYIYKSKQSMKEPYVYAEQVREYTMFFTENIGGV